MSALDRLKAPVFREGTDLAIVNRHDLALVLAVVDAFSDYERLFDTDSVAAMLRYADAVKALAAIEKGDQ